MMSRTQLDRRRFLAAGAAACLDLQAQATKKRVAAVVTMYTHDRSLYSHAAVIVGRLRGRTCHERKVRGSRVHGGAAQGRRNRNTLSRTDRRRRRLEMARWRRPGAFRSRRPHSRVIPHANPDAWKTTSRSLSPLFSNTATECGLPHTCWKGRSMPGAAPPG